MILTNLAKIFKDDAKLCECSQATHVIINEKDSGAKLKKITISELEKDCMVVALDEARNIKNGSKMLKVMSPVFNQTENCPHNRACDVLIFKEKSETEFDVLYIDLKSDKPTGFADQFKSSLCFVRYIEAILQNLCNLKVKIGKERFTILHTDSSGKTISINKRVTSYTQQPTTPEKPKKIVVQNEGMISFKYIR